jgi:hypothetical protein
LIHLKDRPGRREKRHIKCRHVDGVTETRQPTRNPISRRKVPGSTGKFLPKGCVLLKIGFKLANQSVGVGAGWCRYERQCQTCPNGWKKLSS